MVAFIKKANYGSSTGHRYWNIDPFLPWVLKDNYNCMVKWKLAAT